MGSQWDNFLKNLGTWRGSFTGMSLDGAIQSEVPSRLTLDLVDGDRDRVLFTLCRFGVGEDQAPTQQMSQVVDSLGRHALFFDTGSFSKGSMCLSSISPFIAEFGFIVGDRRMRMVQQYNDQFHFDQLVFIREFREGRNAQERPPLTVEQLLGTWEAEYYVHTPDFNPPTIKQSRMVLQREGDCLNYTLELEQKKLTAKAQIRGNQLLFTEGKIAQQMTLLPDGASLNVPPQLERKQAFFVEAGWLVSDHVRHRMMRNFNANGDWENSTFIIEKRVA